MEQQGRRPDNSAGMSLVVKTVTRWLKGVIFLFGLYIVLYGHLTPGGGFAGGVICAAAFILLTLAFGAKEAYRHLPRAVAEKLDSLGALGFLAVALLGIWLGRAFFRNFISTATEHYFRLPSAGIVIPCNLFIAVKVASSLFLIFIMLSVLHVVVAGEGKRFVARRKHEP